MHKFCQSGEILPIRVTLAVNLLPLAINILLTLKVIKYSYFSFCKKGFHNHEEFRVNPCASLSVWPDWAIYWILGHFLEPLEKINLPKSPTFLGNFCTGVKMNHFSIEINFGQLLWTFGDFFLVTLLFILYFLLE